MKGQLVIASPTFDGARDQLKGNPQWRIVSNQAEARAAVREAIDGGADFIKVYNSLSRESYFAIADEAHKRGISFVGHVPFQVRPQECASAGQKSIEHVFGVESACSDGYETWRQAVIGAAKPTDVPPREPQTRIATFKSSRLSPIVDAFHKHHTWLCPTLVASRGLAVDPTLANSPHLKYVGRTMLDAWRKNPDPYESPTLAQGLQGRYDEVVGAMHRAGVGILLGTDIAPANPFIVPGFSVHDELRFLVGIGLTPMEALQTATSKAAEFLGQLDSNGTVESGKLAEVVLLDANPLDDIRNTLQINMVFTGGRMYSRPALDAILRGVEADAVAS